MMGNFHSKWAGKIRRFLEAEGCPVRANMVARGVLMLEGKNHLSYPGETHMIQMLLCVGLDWEPPQWRRVSRGLYAALEKKEGGAAWIG